MTTATRTMTCTPSPPSGSGSGQALRIWGRSSCHRVCPMSHARSMGRPAHFPLIRRGGPSAPAPAARRDRRRGRPPCRSALPSEREGRTKGTLEAAGAARPHRRRKRFCLGRRAPSVQSRLNARPRCVKIVALWLCGRASCPQHGGLPRLEDDTSTSKQATEPSRSAECDPRTRRRRS